MASRIQLHNEFTNILGTRYSKVSRVYFQAPEKNKMEYPCIKYSLSGIDTKRANDTIYLGTNKYEITVIDHNPDSKIPTTILARFPMCSFDRQYVAEGLYHTVLTLYY